MTAIDPLRTLANTFEQLSRGTLTHRWVTRVEHMAMAIRVLLAAGAVATAIPTAQVQACSVLSTGTEVGRQRAMWDASTTVYVARIDRLRPSQFQGRPSGYRGVLVPLQVLKGAGPIPWLSLDYPRPVTSCGPYPSALAGTNGDRFIVYSRTRGRTRPPM